jgi:hypothetical protein
VRSDFPAALLRYRILCRAAFTNEAFCGECRLPVSFERYCGDRGRAGRLPPAGSYPLRDEPSAAPNAAETVFNPSRMPFAVSIARLVVEGGSAPKILEPGRGKLRVADGVMN